MQNLLALESCGFEVHLINKCKMAYGEYLKCAENHLKGFVGIGRRSAVAVDNHKNIKIFTFYFPVSENVIIFAVAFPRRKPRRAKRAGVTFME